MMLLEAVEQVQNRLPLSKDIFKGLYQLKSQPCSESSRSLPLANLPMII